MRITWEVEDGYAGKSRPQHSEIDLQQMATECETWEDASRWIDEEIDADFESRITWCHTYYEDVKAEWEKLKEEADAECDI